MCFTKKIQHWQGNKLLARRKKMNNYIANLVFCLNISLRISLYFLNSEEKWVSPASLFIIHRLGDLWVNEFLSKHKVLMTLLRLHNTFLIAIAIRNVLCNLNSVINTLCFDKNSLTHKSPSRCIMKRLAGDTHFSSLFRK